MATFRASNSTGAWLAIPIFLLWLAFIVGWVWNIVKLFGALNDPVTAMTIMRAVGVFALPLGAVLGFL